MTAQLVAREISLAHGPVVVLDGVDLTVGPADRIGLIGPNGVGKSTLLQVLAGRLAPDRGTVTRLPSDAVVTLLDQERDVRAGETVAAHLARRTGVADAEQELEAAATALADGVGGSSDRYALALDRYTRIGAADLDARAEPALERVGLEAARLDQPTTTLSGGQRARVALAATLLARADVLLLDEPTNDFDLGGLDLLEDLLASTSAGLVVVSHDRTFLERTITSVVELDERARTATRFSGGWAAFLTERRLARTHAEQQHATYVQRRDALRDRARRERRWAAKGVREARSRATDNDKFIVHHRVSQSEQLAARAARTERAMERLDVVDKPWEGWELRLSFADSSRVGDVAAALSGAVVRRGEFTLGPIDLVVGGGERVALTGRNGAGKTTLLTALLGDLALDAGTLVTGPSVVVGRLDQARARLDRSPTLLQAWCDETGASAVDARTRLAKVGLGAEHIGRPASRLSPGERTRAVLAAFAETGVNVLVLDEPTNHLDLPGIEQLEAALDRFSGTVLLVTHDRALLDAVRVDRRIVVEDGRIVDDVPVTG